MTVARTNGHQSFDSLASMARHNMVNGLSLIERVTKLCDSCLSWKQRRTPFPRKANYQADELLELLHGDLCDPIMPATHGGWRFFLLVDDTNQYMWLTLLSSKAEVAKAIKNLKAAWRPRRGRNSRCCARIVAASSLRWNSPSTTPARVLDVTSPRRFRRSRTVSWNGATRPSWGWL